MLSTCWTATGYSVSFPAILDKSAATVPAHVSARVAHVSVSGQYRLPAAAHCCNIAANTADCSTSRCEATGCAATAAASSNYSGVPTGCFRSDMGNIRMNNYSNATSDGAKSLRVAVSRAVSSILAICARESCAAYSGTSAASAAAVTANASARCQSRGGRLPPPSGAAPATARSQVNAAITWASSNCCRYRDAARSSASWSRHTRLRRCDSRGPGTPLVRSRNYSKSSGSGAGASEWSIL